MTSQQNSSLADFEPEKLQKQNAQKEEDQKVMNLLGRFTAEMLKDAFLSEGGHPLPEWGDGETWRYYYQDECRRRGRRLLKQVGWPIDEKSLYVNIHTGCVQNLIDISTSRGYFADIHTIDSQVWAVIEHWEPYDESKPNKYKILFLKDGIERLKKMKARGRLDSYKKNEVKNIPSFQEEIKFELKKIESSEVIHCQE